MSNAQSSPSAHVAHPHHGELPSLIPFSRPSTPHPHPHVIGFVGLGAMGYPMAKNLASNRRTHPAGSPPVLVYNRSRGKADKLLQELGPEKVKIADSPAQLAKECDVVFTSLATDEAVKDIYIQFAEALKDSKHDKHKIFVETSTIYPKLAGELDSLISGFPHTHLITCPVFGPPAAAHAAQLIIIMSGDYRSKKEVAHMLVPAVGRKVIDLGGNLEKAPIVKLIGNSMIIGSIEIMSEAMTIGQKTGIGQEGVLNIIKELIPAPPMANYGQKILEDNFDGLKGFAIDGGLKDAGHMRRLAAEVNSPLPTIDTAYRNMLTARAIHQRQVAANNAKFDVLDFSALVAGLRVSAGLDGFDGATVDGPVKEDN